MAEVRECIRVENYVFTLRNAAPDRTILGRGYPDPYWFRWSHTGLVRKRLYYLRMGKVFLNSDDHTAELVTCYATNN
jgi:hypothetical protein